MRTLNLGSSELVEGMITDLRKNDLTLIRDSVELAITGDEVEVAPDTGWTLRDSVSMIGQNTLIAGKLHTADAEGFFRLWGRWGTGLEQVVVFIGKFRVV
jgi:hypothetical protein